MVSSAAKVSGTRRWEEQWDGKPWEHRVLHLRRAAAYKARCAGCGWFTERGTSLCPVVRSRANTNWALQESLSRLSGPPKQVLLPPALPGRCLPFLSSLLPRCRHTWASPVPCLQQRRGAAAPCTPSLSPTPRAPSSRAASGDCAAARPPQHPALTWLFHPQPGPWDGVSAAVGWSDSPARKDGAALLVHEG